MRIFICIIVYKIINRKWFDFANEIKKIYSDYKFKAWINKI